MESGLWYQYYFQTVRGRAGLIANRGEIARTLWKRNSPNWSFDEATLARHVAAFDNPDYVDVVIHSCRHRLGLADGYAPYAAIEERLASLPAISVPTITMDGKADGVCRPLTELRPPRDSLGNAPIAWSKVPDAICRKRLRKSSRTPCGSLQPSDAERVREAHQHSLRFGVRAPAWSNVSSPHRAGSLARCVSVGTARMVYERKSALMVAAGKV